MSVITGIRNLTGHRPRPAVALPVNSSPNYCGTCWTPPGQTHELSCPEVTPGQVRAFLSRGAHRPDPEAVRTFRGLLIGLPIGAALWVAGALIAWSLA